MNDNNTFQNNISSIESSKNLLSFVLNTSKGIIDKFQIYNEYEKIYDRILSSYSHLHGDDSIYGILMHFRKTDIRNIIIKNNITGIYIDNCINFLVSKSDNKADKQSIVDIIRIFKEELLASEIFNKRFDYAIKAYKEQHPNISIEELINVNFNYAKGLSYHTINLFSEAYDRVMFMQEEDESQITLRDLYVENAFQINQTTRQNDNDFLELKPTLSDTIYTLVSKDKRVTILIEGDAGIGKSSLVSRIAWDYSHRYFNKKSIWINHSLIIVQLRDINIDLMSPNGKNAWDLIVDYLNVVCSDKKIKNSQAFLQSLEQYIIILDGYDELSILRGEKRIDGFLKSLLDEVEKYNIKSKIIITSRPNYIRLPIPKAYIGTNNNDSRYVITLKHFDNQKRELWLRNAQAHGMNIYDEVVSALSSTVRAEVEAIASTPLTLYLIAHENINLSSNSNIWEIYNDVFGTELIAKRYDRINDNNSINSHPLHNYADGIFEVTKSIAYQILINDKGGAIDEEEITICVNETSSTINIDGSIEDITKILKNCFMLFSFFSNDGQGRMSFYHNCIWEFYLSEKLNDILNSIYQEIKPFSKSNKHFKNILKAFNEFDFLLQNISDNTFSFLRSMADSSNIDKCEWIQYEVKNHTMYHLINLLTFNNSEDISISPNLFTNLLKLTHIAACSSPNNNMLLLCGGDYSNMLPIINSPITFKESGLAVLTEYRNDAYLLGVIDKAIYKLKNHWNQVTSYSSDDLFYKRILLPPAHLIFDSNTSISNFGFIFMDFAQWINSPKYVYNCHFEFISIRGKRIDNTLFVNCTFINVLFRGVDLSDVQFIDCTFENVQFPGSILESVSFSNCNMYNVSFWGASICRSKFKLRDANSVDWTVQYDYNNELSVANSTIPDSFKKQPSKNL